MKKIFNFALYDFANSAFTTIIITFIFATYFAKQIAPNPVLGQSYWGWTIGITGFLVAIIGPALGSFADQKNKIVFLLINYKFPQSPTRRFCHQPKWLQTNLPHQK